MQSSTLDKQQHALPQITAGCHPEKKENPYPITVVYRQVLSVKTSKGKTYTEKLLLINTMEKTLVVDDFEQAIAEWQKDGGIAHSAGWPFVATDAGRNAEAASLLQKGGNILYSHLTFSSHFDTWRVAYSLEAIRDWLFEEQLIYNACNINRAYV